MPILSKPFAFKELRIVVFKILEDLAKEQPNDWEKVYDVETETAIPGKIKHGKLLRISKLASKICDFDSDQKGGKFYELFEKFRPKFNEQNDERWPKGDKIIYLTRNSIEGLLRYLEKKELFNIWGEEQWSTIKLNLTKRFEESLTLSKSELSNSKKNILQKYINAPNSKEFPPAIKNSKWLMFERSDLGISISTIEFEEQGNIVFVSVKTKYNDRATLYNYNYSGVAFKDKGGEYIIINMFRDEGNIYASYIMRLDKYNDRSQEISICHYTFFSIHFRKFITKVVIWKKWDKNTFAEFKEQDIHKTINGIVNSEYLNIPKEIRRFLAHREVNRLSMPTEMITRIEKKDSLIKWVSSNLTYSEKDNTTKIYGDYILFSNKLVDQKDEINNIFKTNLIIKKEEIFADDFCETIVDLFIDEVLFSGKLYATNKILQSRLKKQIKDPDYRRKEVQSFIFININSEYFELNQNEKDPFNVKKGVMVASILLSHSIAPMKCLIVPRINYEKHQKLIDKEIKNYLILS